MGTIKFHDWKYSGTEDRRYFRRGPHDGHPWSVACSHTWLSRPRGFIALNCVEWRECSESYAARFIKEVSLCLVFNAILNIAVSVNQQFGRGHRQYSWTPRLVNRLHLSRHTYAMCTYALKEFLDKKKIPAHGRNWGEGEGHMPVQYFLHLKIVFASE